MTPFPLRYYGRFGSLCPTSQPAGDLGEFCREEAIAHSEPRWQPAQERREGRLVCGSVSECVRVCECECVSVCECECVSVWVCECECECERALHIRVWLCPLSIALASGFGAYGALGLALEQPL